MQKYGHRFIHYDIKIILKYFDAIDLILVASTWEELYFGIPEMHIMLEVDHNLCLIDDQRMLWNYVVSKNEILQPLLHFSFSLKRKLSISLDW